jgi:hypothetical protein
MMQDVMIIEMVGLTDAPGNCTVIALKTYITGHRKSSGYALTDGRGDLTNSGKHELNIARNIGESDIMRITSPCFLAGEKGEKFEE